MRLKLKTDYSTTTLVSQERAEAKLGLTAGYDTTNLLGALDASRKMVERETDRSILQQTFVMKLDKFPSTIYLPKGVLVSVTHVKYVDTSGSTQTLVANTDYYTSGVGYDTGRIIPVSSWPSVNSDQNEVVEVEYVTGYGLSPNDLTKWAENATLLGLKSTYDMCDTGSAYRELVKKNKHYFDYGLQ